MSTEPITRYSGDEGRDRLRHPSINAPHTDAEAHLAVLQQYRSRIESSKGEVNGEPYRHGSESVTGRTAMQASWLNHSDEHIRRSLLDLIDREIERTIEGAGG
jgi:hypothetical protein